ncbi:two-component regulator propeller domain-containing protein [Bernardetia sp. OM2101]|uniref:two-component regulator propeller domain-containing protein n=1 Tax=Bernardetia sp. OM2101 TaxID=3344876 RepID=UPI0035D0F7BA
MIKKLHFTSLFVATYLYFCLVINLYAQPQLNTTAQQGLTPDKSLTQYILTNWTTVEGMPSNTTNHITQDNIGFIWVTGYDGLVRFDGANFHTYTNSTNPEFNTNSFTALEVETNESGKESEIWIGSEGNGLVHYKNRQIESLFDTLSVRIETIYVEKSRNNQPKRIWLGTRGKGIYFVENERLIRWEGAKNTTGQINNYQNTTVKKITGDQKGNIYFAITKVGLVHFDGQKIKEFTQENGLPTDNVTEILYEENYKNTKIYIGTTEGIAVLENNQIRKLEFTSQDYINSIYIDNFSSIWVGTNNGLLRITQDNKVERLNESNGLPHNIVRKIIQDKEKNIWFTCYKGGIVQLKQGKFTNYTTTDGLSNNSINILEPFDKNTLLVGSDFPQLDIIHQGNAMAFGHPLQRITARVKTIKKASDGSVWLGSDNGVIQLQNFDPLAKIPYTKEVFYNEKNGLSSNIVRTILEDKNHNIWIGTRTGGITIISPSGEITYHNTDTDFPSNFIMSIKQDENGIIWVGTNNAGIIKLKDKKQLEHISTEQGLVSDLVFSTYFDKDNTVWATTTQGISKIENNKITNFTAKNGLPVSSIFDILEDKVGNFWCTTSQGIFVMAKKDFEKITNGEIEKIPFELFNKSDGMKESQCSGASFSIQTSDGKFWIPTVGGVVSIDPSSIPTNQIHPNVAINKIIVDGNSMFTNQEPVLLPAGTQRIVFEYSGLSFVHPSDVKFRYKVKGIDKDWISAEEERKATYTNLPPNTYIFQLEAYNEEGLKSDEIATLEFKIEPLFYQTTVFKVITLILFFVIIYLVYRWRVRRVEKRNQRLEKTVEQRTAEINQQKEEIQVQHERLENSYKNIDLVSKMGQQITAELDLKTIVEIVYIQVEKLMSTDGFGIGMYNEFSNTLDFKYYIEKGKIQPNSSDSLDNDTLLSVKSFTKKEEIWINDMEKDYKHYNQLKEVIQDGITNAVIYVPLFLNNQIVGVLTVQSFDKNAYKPESVAVLRALSSYITIALSNAKSFSTIQQKNQEITDSIRYAQTIQQAVLPAKEKLREVFEDNLLVYLPKDVVSGDFYWLSHTAGGTYLVVADCTGHGVPGAFMALIGISIFNELINIQNMEEPADILEKLDQEIQDALQQQQAKNSDGMDLVLCKIETENLQNDRTKITFAGAKNSLFFSHNGKIERIKGSRRSIGGRRSRKSKTPFTQNIVELEKGEILYLTTDGYIDQNAPNEQRLGTQAFMDRLDTIKDIPLKEQQKLLLKTLKDYQKDAPQRDDIAIVGVKL